MYRDRTIAHDDDRTQRATHHHFNSFQFHLISFFFVYNWIGWVQFQFLAVVHFNCQPLFAHAFFSSYTIRQMLDTLIIIKLCTHAMPVSLSLSLCLRARERLWTHDTFVQIICVYAIKLLDFTDFCFCRRIIFLCLLWLLLIHLFSFLN